MLLLTLIGTLLSFAVVLLFSIVGVVLVSLMRGVHPDLRVAYRNFALPCALVMGAGVFIFAVMTEIRHYRQRKSLAAIERMN